MSRVHLIVPLAASLLIALSAKAGAQDPISKAGSNLPGPSMGGLPPGPTVSDWQPRARAVIGGTIVVTGVQLRPAELVAAIGSAGFRLPVRVASSTATRVEIEVPDAALGLLGTLSVGYPDTKGTVLETGYRIDPPAPAITSAGTASNVTPFVKTSLAISIKEFPGATLDVNAVSFGGTCKFKKQSGTNYGPATRQPSLSLGFMVLGWFEASGACQLSVTMKPLAASGSTTGTVTLTTPLTVAAAQQYTFDNTQDLATKLRPHLIHAGLGSICEGDGTGVTTAGSDMQILVRGGPVNVDCVFRTDEWVLPEGVWVEEIRWRSSDAGNRCGLTGTFGGGAYNLTKGSILVRPDASQPVSDFVAFGDKTIVVDGVTFKTDLTGPRTMLKTLTMAGQCASMALPLTDKSGTHPPTTSPQSYGIILDRLVLKGPPGMSAAALKQ